MKSRNRLLTVVLVAKLSLLLAACETQPPAEVTAAQSPASEVDRGSVPGKDASSELQSQPSEGSSEVQQYSEEPLPTIRSASSNDGYQEIEWDDLVPAEYQPQAILAKYQEQLESLDDSDPKAMEIYGNIQAELDNAPVNTAINGRKVKLPGFIAPLENTDGKISEFLLVPYFGACIHVPPPPINQTVMVVTGSGEAIDADDSVLPFWVKGVITTDGESTDIGSAGYRIEQAKTEVFE